jgi:hypothetical protein
MRLLKFIKFDEAKLTIQDLDKDTLIDGNTLKRGDVLVNKLKSDDITQRKVTINNIERTLAKDDELVDIITRYGKYDPSKASDSFLDKGRYKKAIRLEDGTEIKLNDIEKTKEFGSSGGSSKGSVGTDIVETIQCLYLSLVQNLKQYMIGNENINIRNLSINVKSNISITQEKINNESKKWHRTFVATANSLYSERKSVRILDWDTDYVFVHTSHILSKQIFDKYISFQTGIQRNKWMPIDIWAISRNMISRGNKIIEIDTISNLGELENFINSKFESRELVGISLKKLEGDTSTIIINGENSVPDYIYNRIYIASPLNNKMGIDIITNYKIDGKLVKKLGYPKEDKLVFRNKTGKNSDICCEVAGKNSRLGGIQLSVINRILTLHQVEPIISYRDILLTDEEIKSEIINMYNEMYDNTDYQINIFNGWSRIKLISLYQSLCMAIIIHNSEIELVNSILNDIFYFCLSIQYIDGNNAYVPTPKFARIF